MRLGGDQVGRWGLALLAVTGLAGLVLALHGWSGRGTSVAPSLTGGAGNVAGSASSSAPPATTRSPSPAPARATPQSAPAAPASASPGSQSGKAGPLLSSEPFASAAYQIWPGPQSSVAKQALTGLTVSVRERRGSLSVTAGVKGQGPGQTQLYAGGVRVYIVEVSFGDDSGGADYSLGDDGLVVTNAKGRIIQ
jgi:hypothetical protein